MVEPVLTGENAEHHNWAAQHRRRLVLFRATAHDESRTTHARGNHGSLCKCGESHRVALSSLSRLVQRYHQFSSYANGLWNNQDQPGVVL